jgi:hypothetical protein
VSVQRAATSVKRGNTAAYVIQVSTENGSASDVKVALTAQPGSQKPTFTSGCGKDDGTASCTLSAVSDKQATVLHAAITVGSGATSVTSLKLTATASVVTTVKWTLPTASETMTVTAPAASPAKAQPAGGAQVDILPLGPIPDLNGIANAIIGAGNAAGLFPKISPTPAPSVSPSPVAHPKARKGTTGPAAHANASAFALGTPVLTAQVIGLLALAFGIMLTVTRMSVRKRSRPKGEGS